MNSKNIVSESVPLKCDNIGDLDGGVARHLIDREISRAVQDLRDRGEEDEKPRKVVIQLELTNKNGLVVVDLACEAKLPPMRSNTTATKVRFVRNNEAELLFQPGNRENPDQPILDDGTAE
jgi:hypothetical protein